MLKKYKTVLIILVIVVIGFVAYNIFVVGNNNDDAALVSVSAANADTSGGELLILLNTLRAIDLDTSIFQNSEFRGLIDFSIDINPEPVGRSNPFAPIGIGNIVTPVDGQ